MPQIKTTIFLKKEKLYTFNFKLNSEQTESQLLKKKERGREKRRKEGRRGRGRRRVGQGSGAGVEVSPAEGTTRCHGIGFINSNFRCLDLSRCCSKNYWK